MFQCLRIRIFAVLTNYKCDSLHCDGGRKISFHPNCNKCVLPAPHQFSVAIFLRFE